MDEKQNEQTQTAEKTETSESTEKTEQKDDFNAKEAFESIQKSIDERFTSFEGRLNRESKKEKKKESDEKTDKKDDSALIQRLDTLALKSEGIKDQDEIELAHKLKEETGKEMDDLLQTNYFQSELKALRDDKANKNATSNVQGGGGENNAKNTKEYWDAKGTLPTAADVPDKKTRVKIIRDMMDSSKNNGKKFYND